MFNSVEAIEIKKLELNEATENESDFFDFKPHPGGVRQSQVAGVQASWNAQVMAALTVANKVDPYRGNIPFGTVVPAIEAVDWQVPNCDVRPRLLDKSSGQFRLRDSGSMISATKKLPGDKQDHSMKLIAVNGSNIKTYGGNF